MSTSRTSIAARCPVSSSSTGAKPERPGPARERAAAAGLVDDHPGARAVVEDPDERRHAPERGPRGDRVLGGPGQAERAGDLDGLDRLGVDGEQVGGPHLVGEVDRGEPEHGVAAGPHPGDGGPHPRQRRHRHHGRLGLVRRTRYRGEGLEGAHVVGPRSGEVGLADLLGEGVGGPRLGEPAQCTDQRGAVGRRHEQPVDAVADLTREGADRGREHRPPVPLGEQDVLRRGGGAVGQDDDVVAGHQAGDAVGRHVAAVHLDPAAQPGVGRELAHAAAGIAPELTGHGERGVLDLAQGLEEQVDALVVAHDAEREQPHRSVVARGAARAARRAGAVAGRPRAPAAPPSSAARPACSSECTSTASAPPQQRADELPVARARLVRQDVVGDDDDARPPASAAGAGGRAAAPGAPGTTAGTTWTTTMTSTSRSRRPARTQVSGRAHDSTRSVRGKGSTSGVPPGTACSPG